MQGLSGKIAIVTGGGSGLGEAIAKRLAREAVKVVVSDINLQAAERVAKEIGSVGGTASAVKEDTARGRRRVDRRTRRIDLRRAALRGEQCRHRRCAGADG